MKSSEIEKNLSTAERFAALSRVGVALMSELDETRLLNLIAKTACDLTGAEFAAFSLRPANEAGQPLVPSEGNLFHLAAVVGVTQEQEALFCRMPLGGEGLLAPIFRHGVPALVSDTLAHIAHSTEEHRLHTRETAREAAMAYAHGQLPSEKLRSIGIPHGHPMVRSFLGAPLLDHDKQVRGGLLLGHTEPNQFTHEDEALLVGLAAQAAVALENARLYQTAHMRVQELNAIFESIADGVTLVDKEQQLVRENESARRLREHLQGYPEGEGVINALLHTPARSALCEEMVQDITVTVNNEAGEMKEYLVTASPLHLPTRRLAAPWQENEKSGSHTEQTISGAIVVWHDITERRLRESERAAKEHINQLQAMFEAMTDAVFVYDYEGKIIQINQAARELLAQSSSSDHTAFSPNKLFSQQVLSDEHGHPLPLESWPAARILAGEILTPEHAADILFHKMDGHVIHTSVTGGPLHDATGHLTGAVIIVRDVTEHRRLEQIEREARAEAEARLALLQLILDELPSSVYLVAGQDARLVLANRAATAVWGAQWSYNEPLAAFLKKYGIRIFGVDGRSLALSQLATLRAVQHGENVYQHQESIRHRDGSTLPVLVNAVVLNTDHLHLPASAGPHGIADEPAAIVVHQDVTALKEGERLKDEFIALAAHELRTPLAVLKGFAQTLLVQTARGKGPELAAWQTEALEEIDQATARLVTLTEDLLDVTRLQAGKLELHVEPTDLIPLIQRLVTQLQMTTELHQLALHTDFSHLVVSVDPRRIEQVFTNLLSNAIKYSPAGGSVEVTICQHTEEMHMALLSISDHGIGIPRQQQARIFGRFVRAGNVQAYGIGGTGLGLYLCRELIERHGGHIWFESVEGEGATFFLMLPFSQTSN